MENLEGIKQAIVSKNITILYFNFIDLEGQVRSKGMFTHELLKNFKSFFEEGISITANLIDAYQERSDFFIVRPIAETFTVIDWVEWSTGNVAFVLCEIVNSSMNSRMITEKIMAAMMEQQIKPMVGLGLTYQIIGLPEVERIAGLYKCFPGSLMEKFNHGLAISLMHAGIEIEYSVPSGQDYHHLAFVPKDILKSMDNYSLGRWISSAYALTAGKTLHYTKPFENAAPIHLSMWDENGQSNLFYDSNDRFELSSKGYSFMAGVLKYFDEIFAVIAAANGGIPKINYKKTYSFSDDDSVISAPCYYFENEKIARSGWSKRCIFRGIGSNANLYLVTSCIFAAGFEGVQNNYSVSQYKNDKYGIFSSSISDKKRKLLSCTQFEGLLGTSIMKVLEQNLNSIMKEEI